MGVSGQFFALAALAQGRRTATHCTGGCVGPRAGLDRCWISRSNRYPLYRGLCGSQDRSGPVLIFSIQPLPIVQGAVWAPGPVWIGAEFLDPTTTHCTGGCVGPRAGLDRCWNSRSNRYPLYRGLCGAQGRSGPVLNFSIQPLPITQGAVWAPGPVWTGAEILDPTATHCTGGCLGPRARLDWCWNSRSNRDL